MTAPNAVISVLIVEDNRVHRMCASQSLANYTQAKIQRHHALTVAEARDQFNILNPNIVLLDINLPDGNGLELLPELLKIRPKCFIVMMTGSTSEEDFKRSKALGARGYILKPFNMQLLHRTVTASRYFYAHIDSSIQVNRDNANALFITMPDIESHLTKPEPPAAVTETVAAASDSPTPKTSPEAIAQAPAPESKPEPSAASA
ncbi:MAG: response regulator [Alphaproteobacteria bacterium]